MEYRFIHYWQYEPGEEENQILEAAIALSLQPRTTGFLQEVATFISEHIGPKYLLIGCLSEGNTHVKTCVYLEGKEKQDNMTYALQGTPCEAVFTQRFCYYPLDVAQNFPDDREIQQLGIDSYLGSLLMSEQNDPIGIIALMDVKPIENAAFAEHLILVLSPAIEEELLRTRA